MPVTLPPGRAMLDASPSATGSPPVVAMTMGMVRVAPNAASVPLVESVTITSTGVRTSSAARPGRASAEIESDRLPFDVAKIANSPVESLERGCRVSYSGCEDANANLRRLLRARRERPCRGAADEGDELAAVHSVTSSARNSSAGEIVISSVERTDAIYDRFGGVNGLPAGDAIKNLFAGITGAPRRGV